jgi:murein DD-endopeptidase MepM/ murein hydrolase activator NlpD
MRLLTALLATLFLASPTLLDAPAWARATPTETTPAPARQGVWPLSPRPQVVRGFDPPATRWGAGHRGVDLLGHVGQPVHTSLGGTVTFAAPLAGRGVVVVDHGGVRTTYEPVSASVGVGDSVARGAVIGTLQRASSHCFPSACLHWGLLRGDAYLNPLTLVGAGPIRLLPLSGGPPSGGQMLASSPSAPPRSLSPGPDRAV